MTTPYTYGQEHFAQILNQFKDLSVFHQTSISNLASIIQSERVYSTGTLWGMDSSSRIKPAKNQTQQRGWEITADLGFIDYVFNSSLNYISDGNSRYGMVSLEFDKSVLKERDTFIFPRTIRFDFSKFKPHEKNSDTTMWMVVLRAAQKYDRHEILIRRRIKLEGFLKGIHCFDKIEQKVRQTLQGTRFQGIPVTSYANPSTLGEPDMKAQINGMEFDAVFSSADKTKVKIFNALSESESEYFGEYDVNEHRQIIEDIVLTNEKEVIGVLQDLNVRPFAKSGRT